MKYSEEITIKLPRDRVIELFDNPDNLHKWMPGLQSFEQISGQAGEKGAKSKMVFDSGKRRIEMVETIVEHKLPQTFNAIYEAKGVWNLMENSFHESSAETTRWQINTEFKMKGFLKLVAFFMPGAFRKQTRKNMEQFRDFAEAEGK